MSTTLGSGRPVTTEPPDPEPALSPEPRDRSRTPVARIVAAVSNPAVIAWIAARVVVLGALALARFLASDLGAMDPQGREPSGLVGWDAHWYLRIIESGYQQLPPESLRFFPLLPVVARAFGPIFGPRVALLLVVNAASLAAGVLIERLVRRETGDADVASRSAWYLALLPSAFVLVMGYAESLLMCLAIATFLALRRDRWGLAAVAGLLAGLSRPLGLLLMLPAAIEAARGFRGARLGQRVQRLAAVAAPAVGGIVYLGWSWVAYGDPMRPLRLQQEVERRGAFENPIRRLAEAAGDLISGGNFGSGLHFPWAIAFLALLVICFRRLPASYGVYAGAILLIAMSAQNLDSLERYGLSAFPLLIALGYVLRPAWLDRAAVALSAVGLLTYATLAFLGAYVP